MTGSVSTLEGIQMAREGFDPDREIPVRRGRRDPDMAIALGLDDNADHTEQDDLPMLSTGDVVSAKVTLQVQIGKNDAWFTYEVKTRVMPGESEEEVSERVKLITNTRVLENADDAEARINDREHERRTAHIVPR